MPDGSHGSVTWPLTFCCVQVTGLCRHRFQASEAVSTDFPPRRQLTFSGCWTIPDLLPCKAKPSLSAFPANVSVVLTYPSMRSLQGFTLLLSDSAFASYPYIVAAEAAVTYRFHRSVDGGELWDPITWTNTNPRMKRPTSADPLHLLAGSHKHLNRSGLAQHPLASPEPSSKACTIRLFIPQFSPNCTIRAKSSPGRARPRLRWGRRHPSPPAPLKQLNGAVQSLNHRETPLLLDDALADEGCPSSTSPGQPSMSCPSGEACSMGERRLTVNRRTPEKRGGPRLDDDITVIDDNPVLVVPVIQEPEPKPTKISLPSVKPKGGGASKRWALLLVPSPGNHVVVIIILFPSLRLTPLVPGYGQSSTRRQCRLEKKRRHGSGAIVSQITVTGI
ncbi:hypothetical protein BaRGS_00010552 [Batillaria attramentaria]|uniref:Uncharacterized protein n=1 Tax=Batillaria attramentaria TaxID=370345 RepID=A0ABD0LG47_9CAEN